jgi:hypothetical protein
VARLIEIRPGHRRLPATLTLRTGDLLLFAATGGRVTAGAAAVELVGIFQPGVLADDGRILAPAGAPGTVVFRVRGPGRASIEVVTGDPWRSTETAGLDLVVEPAP